MASTIINLDEMIPEERTVRYKGKEHILEVANTETYLKILKARRKLGKLAEEDEAAQTELAIEMLVLALPTMSKDDLMKLPLKAMMKLVDVVQAEMDLADVAEIEQQVDQMRSEQALDVSPNGKPKLALMKSTLDSSSPE